MKKMLTTFVAVTLLAFASAAPADAGKKRNVGIAVAAGIAAIGLAAASAAAADRGNEYYDYSHGHGDRTNAIAACVHRADREVRRQGGMYIRLDRVHRTERVDRGIRVVADMTGVYPRFRKTSTVRCVVDHDRVVRFRYN